MNPVNHGLLRSWTVQHQVQARSHAGYCKGNPVCAAIEQSNRTARRERRSCDEEQKSLASKIEWKHPLLESCERRSGKSHKRNLGHDKRLIELCTYQGGERK